MCSSLAEGGLRCPSHVKKDIAKLEQEGQTLLENEAKLAGVPLDQEYIDNRVARLTKGYRESVKEHATAVASYKEKLLDAHKEAMDAKTALEENPVNDESFTSTANDISGLAESLVQKLSGYSKNAIDARNEIQNRPEFTEFEHTEEYIDSFKLLDSSYERLDDFEESLVKKRKALNAEREEKLHRDNPMLKKLRSKAAIAEFLNSSSVYDKDKVYQEALQAEKGRTGFEYAQPEDFPETVAKIKEQKIEIQQLVNQRNVLQGEFNRNVRRLQAEGKEVKYTDSYKAEELIRKSPTPGTMQEMNYRNKVRNFNKLKETYTALASMDHDVEKAKEQYRAEVTAEAPLNPEKLKTFKSEVYNKTPEAKRISAELREKRVQLSLTTQSRLELQDKATRLLNANTEEKTIQAHALLERKKKLDALAEKTMGENRLKAIMNEGISKEAKKNLKAQKQSAPSHYRTNLANIK